jgi:hypothetical protein
LKSPSGARAGRDDVSEDVADRRADLIGDLAALGSATLVPALAQSCLAGERSCKTALVVADDEGLPA